MLATSSRLVSRPKPVAEAKRSIWSGLSIARVMAVSVTLGRTAFTRIPRPARSAAAEWNKTRERSLRDRVRQLSLTGNCLPDRTDDAKASAVSHEVAAQELGERCGDEDAVRLQHLQVDVDVELEHGVVDVGALRPDDRVVRGTDAERGQADRFVERVDGYQPIRRVGR